MMDDETEIELKKICCTCLSVDRKLIQLCKINDGVNNLYFLLSYDPEAYKEGFFKDLASLHICWECKALIRGIVCFRLQACAAQRQLASPKTKHFNTLSKLSTHLKFSYDDEIISNSLDNLNDNFIDCNAVEIKTEIDDDDIPLSQLHSQGAVEDKSEDSPNGSRENNSEKEHISELHDNFSDDEYNEKTLKTNIKLKKEKTETKTRKQKIKRINKKYYKTVLMDEKEMIDNRENIKQDPAFMGMKNKCESCLESFKTQTELEEHNVTKHTEKPDHILCDTCLCYVPTPSLLEHRNTHLLQYSCLLCEHNMYSLDDVVKHLDIEHGLKNLGVTVKRKKGRNAAMMDKRTPRGYQCTECSKYFENKNQRWRHVQRCHSEGYRCHTCGKRFAFKHSLSRHEQMHSGPPPREECPVCHKMIRVDLLKIHSQIHSDRKISESHGKTH